MSNNRNELNEKDIKTSARESVVTRPEDILARKRLENQRKAEAGTQQSGRPGRVGALVRDRNRIYKGLNDPMNYRTTEIKKSGPFEAAAGKNYGGN